MGKIRKFFLSPALYWRDFLLKRYPLTVSEGKSKSRLYQKPDFYFVHTHAVGQTSFRRCLAILGMPIVNFYGKWDCKKGISRHRKISGCLEDIFTLKKTNKYVGISIDRYISYGGESLFSEYAPAYVLVRDPISVIKSYLNHKIAYGTLKNSQGHWDTYWSSLDYRIHFVTHAIRDWPHVFRFSSTLKTIKNSSHIKVIDTTDISKENICDTMSEVAGQFGIEITDSIKNKFIKTFLPAQNFFIPPHILVRRGKTTITLQVIPNSSRYDDRNDDFAVKIISNNSARYILRVLDGPIDCGVLNDIIEDNLDEIMCYANFYTERSRMMEMIYSNSMVSEDDVIDIIRRDPIIVGDFNKVMDVELEVIERVRPSLIDTWAYFKQVRG